MGSRAKSKLDCAGEAGNDKVYQSFKQKMQNEDYKREEEQNKKSYSYISVMKLLMIYDTYASLAEGFRANTFFMMEKISHPEHLAMLIRMSVQPEPNVQFIAHRILQSILKFDVPAIVLN